MYFSQFRALIFMALVFSVCPFGSVSVAQEVPAGDQLNELLAPIALYPDTLLAQICAASTDPQQIIDADTWLKQNNALQGQALTDAAQQQGFDPAYIALVTFPTVLDAMATHIDDYAALGAAFKADQETVMSAIQVLRQQAYASGALDSNQYQNVAVEEQNGAQVVVVQPANPQIIYVPQYQPERVYVSDPGDVVAGSLLSFGAGIAIGALIVDRPWGWSNWGWGWGGRGMLYGRSVWGFNNRYRSPRAYYRPRPPIYNRPIYARPPPDWNHRPGYRPGGFRPGTPGRPPGPGQPGVRPGGGGRPPGNVGGGRPPGSSGGRPPGNTGGSRPPGNAAGPRPAPNPGRPGGGAPSRPNMAPRPNIAPRPAAPPRPAAHNPYAGFGQGGNRLPQAIRPTPTPQSMGARPGALGGRNPAADRAASQRGRASAGAPGRQAPSRQAPARQAPNRQGGGRRP